MGFSKWIIRAASPAPAPEQYDRFLFIGPHPDDIEIGAGATAAKLASTGKVLRFLICTDGRYGFDHAPAGLTPDELADRRKQEALRSAELLGVRNVHFAGLSDGGFYSQKDLFRTILSAVSDFQPDVIFCPDPFVSSECHPDHLNVGNTAKQAACIAPNAEIMKQYGLSASSVKAIAFYMTARPNRFVNTSGYLQQQLDAIFSCHTSQFPQDSPAAKSVSLYLKLRAYDFGLHSLHKTAEGFRVLSQQQMHCLPEAGL